MRLGKKGVILKKAFALWKNTTKWYWIAIPLLLAGVVLLSVFLWVRPVYILRINELTLSNRQTVYLFVAAAALLAMCITLFQVWHEAVRSEFQMAYWAVLAKRELYVYIMLKKVHWYYVFLTVMVLAGGELWGIDFSSFCLTTMIYLVLTVIIYFQSLHMLHRGGRFQKRKNKAGLLEKRRILDGYSHPNLELILIGWRYRYLSLERALTKAVVLGIALFLLGRKLSDPYCTVAFFALFFILSCVDDNYWNKETANTVLFRNMGIPFGRYFLIHAVSGILFYSVLLSILYALASGSILKGAIFLSGTAALVCYWNTAYLYLYLSGGERADMLKQIYLLAVLAVMLIPVGNLAMGLFLWGKVRKIWRDMPC